MDDLAVLPISDLLADYGVRAGRPELREQVAKDCAAAGMTGDDANVLHDWFAGLLADRSPTYVAGYLATVVVDPAKWRPLVDDARRALANAQRKAKRLDATPPEHHARNMPSAEQQHADRVAAYNRSEDEWEVWDRERRLVARVRGDGYPQAQVAQEAGLSEEAMAEIMEKHSEYLLPKPDQTEA